MRRAAQLRHGDGDLALPWVAQPKWNQPCCSSGWITSLSPLTSTTSLLEQLLRPLRATRRAWRRCGPRRHRDRRPRSAGNCRPDSCARRSARRLRRGRGRRRRSAAEAAMMAAAMDLRMMSSCLLYYRGNTPSATWPRKRKKKGRPARGALLVQSGRAGRLMPASLALLWIDRGLVEDLEDLGQRRLLVGLLHRAELARQARRGGFENLPLGIALLGRIVGAEQVAGHFGDRGQVARIDLRFIFLGAARPHGALDLGLALQGLERVLHRLVATTACACRPSPPC